MPDHFTIPHHNGTHPHTLHIGVGDNPAGLKAFVENFFTPLFMHRYDDDPDLLVRGAIPINLINGLADTECPCCGSKCQRSPNGELLYVDIDYHEIDAYIEATDA